MIGDFDGRLSGNEASEEGLSFHQKIANHEIVNLIEDLKDNKESLKSLVIRDCNIEDYVLGIVDALKNNSTLEVLTIEGSEISNDVVVALVDAIKDNKTLKHITLSCCEIGDVEAKTLEEFLISQGEDLVLGTLSLTSNRISEEAIKSLRDAWKACGKSSYFLECTAQKARVLEEFIPEEKKLDSYEDVEESLSDLVAPDESQDEIADQEIEPSGDSADSHAGWSCNLL